MTKLNNNNDIVIIYMIGTFLFFLMIYITSLTEFFIAYQFLYPDFLNILLLLYNEVVLNSKQFCVVLYAIFFL